MGGSGIEHAASVPGPLSIFRGEQRLSVIVLLFAIGTIAAVAWLVTAWTGQAMTSSMMASMVASGDLSMLGFFLLVWGIMMVAMMFPAAAPMIRTYVHLSTEEGETRTGRAARTSVFLGTYAIIWASTGIVVAVVYLLLGQYLDGFAASGTLAPAAVGGVLILAGLYQATPLKDACLDGCRNPMAFLIGYWRPGPRGAAWLGARHAAYCIGCCWMLFAVLFVVGVMAIAWMALLAAMIFFEKLFTGRAGRLISAGIGGGLATLGVLVVLFPAWVPGLLGL